MALVLLAAAALAGCGSPADRITEQREAIVSLRATTTLILRDWIGGDISATFARTALESTSRQVEIARQSLTSDPKILALGDGAALAETSLELQRTIGMGLRALAAGDRSAAQAALSRL